MDVALGRSEWPRKSGEVGPNGVYATSERSMFQDADETSALPVLARVQP